MRVRLHTSEGRFLEEISLRDGELVLLESGAHEIFFDADTEIFEVKQGPYYGIEEKRWLRGARSGTLQE